MIILKLVGRILAIPLLVVTSLMWLVVKAMIAIYGLCYGILGIALVVAMILFLVYQEWANVIALIVIAVIAFVVLFARMNQEEREDALGQMEAMLGDEASGEMDYDTMQEILDKYGNGEKEEIFSLYIECIRRLIARLVLESYDVAAYVYQKHCIEKQSLEEMLETTRLSETALNMFVKYFDVREKQNR